MTSTRERDMMATYEVVQPTWNRLYRMKPGRAFELEATLTSEATQGVPQELRATFTIIEMRAEDRPNAGKATVLAGVIQTASGQQSASLTWYQKYTASRRPVLKVGV